MVIVVPALTEGKDGDPETVRRGVASKKTPGSPHVRCGIHQPSGVQTDNCPKEDAPKHEGPPPNSKERNTKER